MRLLRTFLFVFGFILLGWVAIDYVPLALQWAGDRTTGKVVSKEVVYQTPDRSDAGTLTLGYEFDAGPGTHSGKGTVSRGAFEKAEEGGPVGVVYLPSHPDVSLPDGYFGQGVRGIALLTAGILSLVCGIAVGRLG